MAEIPLGICQCGCGLRTNTADRNRMAQGHVKGQPYRYLAGHFRPQDQLATVDLQPFRERFERMDVPVEEIARRMGVDGARVRRLLKGTPNYTVRNGYRSRLYRQKTATYEVAEALMRAMDVDPWEVGL
jgi:hypothetical protein